MNIASVNLNLLVVFEALIEERSVSRAATRVGLSQPALSNALGRLRATFSDPLFTRTSRGMTATAAGARTGGTGPQRFDATAKRSRGAAALRSRRQYAQFPSRHDGLRANCCCSARCSAAFSARRPRCRFWSGGWNGSSSLPKLSFAAGAFDAAIGFFPEANALEPGHLFARPVRRRKRLHGPQGTSAAAQTLNAAPIRGRQPRGRLLSRRQPRADR